MSRMIKLLFPRSLFPLLFFISGSPFYQFGHNLTVFFCADGVHQIKKSIYGTDDRRYQRNEPVDGVQHLGRLLYVSHIMKRRKHRCPDRRHGCPTGFICHGNKGSKKTVTSHPRYVFAVIGCMHPWRHWKSFERCQY